jgi:serine/threonine protein kinase
MATSRALIADNFEVEMGQPLGVGGMAMVYKGRDLRTGRDVAIKTLRPEYAADPDSRARFRREARLMAFVKHPNLVSIFDLHEDASGSWVVMEYVPGPTLKSLIQDEGPMSPEAVLPILEQLADAFSHIHGNNLVHLDIKPQNIIIRSDGVPKLIDFGLAQPAGEAQRTDNGVAFGTVAYLAPEQATGGIVDATTDIYSLGCVVYEMLTGRPPFMAEEGPDHQRTLIQAHIDKVPVSPSQVRPELQLPSWVDDVVGWALAKDRKDRYHDASTFARMFRSGLEGEIVPQSDLTSVVRRTPDRSVGPTGRFVRSVAAVDDDIESLDESNPSTLRRAYNAGGRLARRSRRVKRTMWRLAMILAVGNLLLGMVLVSRDGPAALVERFLSIAPGTETSVSVDELNLRMEPGVGSDIIVVLTEDMTVRVTGLSQLADDERWWPVEVEYEGVSYEGWVWDGGLQANAWTGRMSWMQNVVDRVNSVRRGVNDTFDDVVNLWPFWIVLPGV